MPAGDLSTIVDLNDIEEALAQASKVSGYTFNLNVATLEGDPRSHAVAVHNATEDPDNTVLIELDITHHTVEIVTGRAAQRTLMDSECQFAMASMLSSFRNGDITGGLVQGIAQLGESARSLPVHHARQISDF